MRISHCAHVHEDDAHDTRGDAHRYHGVHGLFEREHGDPLIVPLVSMFKAFERGTGAGKGE